MIELIYILRAIVEEIACGGERGEGLHQDSNRKCDKSVPPIKFSDLERLVYDELWHKDRIAIYTTAWEMERELERLADLGVLKYESGEVKIEDPNEFLKKTEPFILVARNMIGGNEYLKYVIRKIQDSAKEYAAKNIKGSDLVLQHV
jgi:hypothetical protein